MSIADARAGLENGSVDVALLAGAAAYQADKAGCHLITNGDGLIKAIIAVAVRDDFYQAYPEVIERLEDAQEEIAAFMEENPEETTELVAEALDLDTEAVEEMAAYYDFSTELSEDDIAGFQKTADFMLEAGMIDNAVDVTTLFYE
jgi:sulfonate transport system substrate-binding protein